MAIKITENLNKALSELIISLDSGVITARRREWMVKHLSQFCIDAISKFIAGQEEHGGDSEIEDIALLKALKEELIDGFWYSAAKTQPMKKR